MRIGQIATLSARVGRESRGSVETWLWHLTRELHRLGHEVTVFATGDSDVPHGELVATLPGPYGAAGSLDDWYLCEWANLCRGVQESGRFDVLHSHAYLWGLPLDPLARAPMVHTTHIVPDDNTAGLWFMQPGAIVTAISRHQWSGYPQLQPAAIIPHGVDTSQFTFSPKPGDYVCYLGRFVSGKGPILAIQTAQQLGIRLLMAGPPNAYFRENIQPRLDGRTVEYVGYLTGAERDKFLGGARALLYPIQYPESFGLVLLEAMLCGTPVAAMRLGAVPEIVEEGITGFTAATPDTFAPAVSQCFALDRKTVRARAEERFNLERMAREYLQVYQKVIEDKGR